MSKILLSAVIAAALGGTGMYINRANTPEEVQSDLLLENVEALSRSEIGELCGGCGTNFQGRYCCTVIFKDVPFTLYHPWDD